MKPMTAAEFFGEDKAKSAGEAECRVKDGVWKGRRFLLRAGLRCLGNFAKNYEGNIDSETFAFLDKFVTRDRLASLLAARLRRLTRKMTAARIKRIKEQITNMSDSVGDAVVYAWRDYLCGDSATGDALRKTLAEIVGEALKTLPPSGEKEAAERRLDEISETLGLSDIERQVFLVSFLNRIGILNWPNSSHPSIMERPCLFAACVGCSPEQVLAVTGEKSPLRRFECVDDDLDFNARRFEDFMLGFDTDPLASDYYVKVEDETLPMSFFGDELAAHAETIRRLVGEPRETKPGESVNILLYGVPGTGKSSFVRAVAKLLGRTLYQIPQIGRDHGERNSVAFRLNALSLCEAHVKRHESVILVDEADLILGGGDKGLLNASIDCLTAEGKRTFFKRMFRQPLTEAEAARLDAIGRLTPGDFRTARQSLHYLGGETTNAERLEALEQESRAKTAGTREDGIRSIGFTC